MASFPPVAADADPDSETPLVRRPPRTPAYRDPLTLAGLCLALAALLTYWYLFVRRPAPQRGDEVARLTALVGQVKLKVVAQDAWVEARVSDRLRVGDVVLTEPASGAEIAFDAGNVVRVRPGSVVHIGGSAEASTAAWRVQSGRVNFSGAQRAEIFTPSLRTTAAGDSAGAIDVSETGATGVKIFEGEARIETLLAQRITLTRNEAVQVDAAGRAGAKLALPPPPELVAPPARTEIPADAAARLIWSAVPSGVSYRLAVDYNVVQANLLLAAALDEPGLSETYRELTDLNPGRYFWRVAAVNSDGLEGAFSRASVFAVVPALPAAPPRAMGVAPPALELYPLDEVAPGIVHVSGRTNPGAGLTLNGAPVRVLPDGSFSEHLQAAPAQSLLVRSSDAAGRTSERSLRVPRR